MRFALRLTAFWTGVGLLLLAHGYLVYLAEGLPFTWTTALFTVGAALPWIVLTPLVRALVYRFPLERGVWGRHLAVHVLAATATNVVLVLLFVGVRAATGLLAARGISFGEALTDSLLRSYFFHQLLYAGVAGVFHAQRYHAHSQAYGRALQEREVRTAQLETQLAHAQLQALRMQLNPHFLFNTLHAISSLVTQDAREARRVIVHLSELLRLTLERAGDDEVTLADELDFLEAYLAIEQTRFRDRLEVRLEVPPALRAALVPNLILQPLVENAIKHGITPYDAGGCVTIGARRDGEHVVLTVRDTGRGLAPGGLPARPGGIGLENTRARLERLYGAAARLHLANHPEGGLEATLVLPHHEPVPAASLSP